jgi:MFS family permease
LKLPLWVSALSATLLVQVVSSFAAASVPLLGPVLMQRWGLSAESIGYVLAMSSVGICWCLACGNPMLDHYGPIRTLQIGLVSIAAGTVLLSLSVPALGFLGALLIGLGTAPNNPAGSKVLLVSAPKAHRTLIFSIRQAGVPAGGAIAGLVVAAAMALLGLNGALLAVVAVVLFCVAAVQPFQLRLDAERGPVNRAWARMFVSPSALMQTARVIRSHPSLPSLTAAGISFSVAQASVTAFTATFLVTRHGTTISEAGTLIAVLLDYSLRQSDLAALSASF